MRERSFRYYADPVCMAALSLYAANRWVLKPHGIGGGFCAEYLNDVLCLPVFLPMILCVQRMLGVRRHDEPPHAWEVVQHWLIFSAVFEIAVPKFRGWFASTADLWDVVAYLAGGLAAWLIWWTPRLIRTQQRGT